MRKLAGYLFFPLAAQAAGNRCVAGSIGVTLSNRGQAMSSYSCAFTAGSGLMTVVSWRYELIGPTPAGLRVRLCSQTRCVQLDAKAAPLVAFAGVPAIEPLRFIWEVPAADD
jgi:flagellar protein FlhE